MLADFKRVLFVDFEFRAGDGERPRPVCLVVKELGQSPRRIWLAGSSSTAPPFPMTSNTLYCAYYASAEIGCHLALGWPVPPQILDLYTEFRNATNGLRLASGSGLLGALVYFGLPGIESVDKESMRELVLRGGPWSDAEKTALLDYCESDVLALEQLFRVLCSNLDLPRALLRGRYMAAAARMEWWGVPIDIDLLASLRDQWDDLKASLVADVDRQFNVFEGSSFRSKRWSAWLEQHGIPWPRSAAGRLVLDEETFRRMATTYPVVRPMHELRQIRGQLRPPALTVGGDGRNRTLLSAFRSRTGRNQPSNSKFIVGSPAWMRGLIRPKPGTALAYIDWSQQEFGIAAALSGDPRMLEAYRSGDPYLAFAKQAKALPPDATKESAGPVRDRYKACVLGVQYGMGEQTLAERIGKPRAYARQLLDCHRRTYRVFWEWSTRMVDGALMRRSIRSVFGWNLHVGADTKIRTLRNFPMQANGAEMLRLACIAATEKRIRVLAPIHDAVLIEAPVTSIESEARQMEDVMAWASRQVLPELELRCDVRIVQSGERLLERRGEAMFERIQDALASCANTKVVPAAQKSLFVPAVLQRPSSTTTSDRLPGHQ